MAQTAVKRVNKIRQEQGLPYAVIARSIGLAESTLRRWRGHEKRHVNVLTVPGPKKTVPVDMGALMSGMMILRPGRYRTAGAPDLWKAHQDQISRRDFYSMLTRFSVRLLEQERQGWYRYHWLKVGAVWSMDDMDFGCDENGCLLRVHNVMDIGSRNMFEPLNSHSLTAEKVALNLDGLFQKHGVPPFLKSDNGSNLIRSNAVSEVLSRHGVIPLLSPAYYPQYNGVMERGQSDTRVAVTDLLPNNVPCDAEHFRAYAVAGTYRRNHICRDSLGGQHACHVFSTRNGEMKTDIRERRSIYDWIKDKQESILSSSVNDRDGWAVNAAWRSASEEWLLQNKVIEVIPGTEKVSTDFGALSAHN
jgi:transposase InsO family protein